ncbi:hypothetical protein MRB53_040855 [Persea americana]|nr:hypothetical protein MRB53_040855 [Persea americana]
MECICYIILLPRRSELSFIPIAPAGNSAVYLAVTMLALSFANSLDTLHYGFASTNSSTSFVIESCLVTRGAAAAAFDTTPGPDAAEVPAEAGADFEGPLSLSRAAPMLFGNTGATFKIWATCSRGVFASL